MTRGASLAFSPSKHIDDIQVAIQVGALQRAGGILDQDADFVEDLDVVIKELAKIEKEVRDEWSRKRLRLQ